MGAKRMDRDSEDLGSGPWILIPSPWTLLPAPPHPPPHSSRAPLPPGQVDLEPGPVDLSPAPSCPRPPTPQTAPLPDSPPLGCGGRIETRRGEYGRRRGGRRWWEGYGEVEGGQTQVFSFLSYAPWRAERCQIPALNPSGCSAVITPCLERQRLFFANCCSR